MQANRNILGIAPVRELLIKFSVPAIIGMMINALYNIVDRIFIGNAPGLGANGLAGITIGFPIMIVQASIGLLFGVGGATLFSIRLGQTKEEEATHALNTAFLMALSSGITFMVLGHLFLNIILTWFGASETILPFSAAYMRVIFFGSLFQIVSMTMNNFLRADGQPRLAMLTMFFGAGTNILLDPIFIYVLGWGMAGAAWATILSQFISMSWTLYYFFNQNNTHHIRLNRLRYDMSEIFQIIKLGLPTFLTQIGSSLLNLTLNRTLLQYGGDIAVSGMGIINSIITFIVMPILGINQGVQPIVSFNFGAKKYDRIIEAEKLAIGSATILLTLGWLITRLFPQQIIGVFNSNPDLMAFTQRGLNAWLLCLPLIGFQILGSSFFQATGYSKRAMFLTLTRQIIFLIPAIIIFSRLWGLDGVIYAAPFADASAIIVTAITYFKGIKQLKAGQL
ncbi:MATE family efflux transporter [Tuanshanicoccus lijuaniae]|uniref:MATE family efflux transporter n=1 Tax=Aerococcaceae bacterium zg-1292 TaxID=2774330 RepID=UPI0019351686|nr:MATE family efflux transporter [Aerococcaceae bacterium zg-1292]QQA36335.1 MATE family efflux transporter [Aerococcaceae bacterium zg-1292]